MKWKLTHGNRFLTLYEASSQEIEMVKMTFTKQIENARFNPKVKKGIWDGNVCLFKSGKYLPSGLWSDLVDMCRQMDYELHIDQIEEMFDHEISLEEFTEWVEDNWKDAVSFRPQEREYQIITAYKIIKNKCCLADLATSAGKTLITYMVIGYLMSMQKAKKILMIVPNVDLVNQSADDFLDYDKESLKLDLNIQRVYAGMKLKENSNIVIGTYQSLVLKEPSFFEDFDCVIVDETHKAKGYSIQSILEKCVNSNRRFGVSGTIPKPGTLDRLTVMAQTGPVVQEVKADFLSKEGFISNCDIYVVEMDYAPMQVRHGFYSMWRRGPEERKKVLELEKNYVIESKKRLDFVTDAILKIPKNSLVLFHRLHYGQRLYDMLREKTNRRTFYIDGSVEKDFRESFKDDMEDGNEKVMVASYGTFSTGINVRNIHCVSLTESFKSDIIIRQSIGRGLRLHSEKNKLLVLDFVDDFRYYEDDDLVWQNYLYKHSIARRQIYNDQNFNYSIKKISFSNT